MNDKFKIKIFGKLGCAKCKLLNQRLDKILTDKKWAEFGKEYCDIETVDGLIAFASAECIHPARIPALLVTQRQEETKRYIPVSVRNPQQSPDKTCGKAKLYQYVGLQTDYTSAGKGIISPKMITAILEEACA